MEQMATSEFISTFKEDAIADFEAVVKLYRPKIFRFFLASLRDRESAENLTQDCFLNAYRSLDGFRNDCSMSTWLMQIAVNVLRDHAKNRRLQFWRRVQQTAKPLDEDLRGLIADHHKTPEAYALLKEQVDAIWDAVALLADKQRTVFVLRFVEDMELRDIVTVTGMKEGTVKTHLFRAVHSIRERMGVGA